MKDFESKNYYQLLGLKRTAAKEEIKEAYKNLALLYHPDSNFFSEIIDSKPSTEQSDIFKVLTAAYNTLLNPESRAAYDDALPPELPGWDQEKVDLIGSKITTYSPAKQGNCGATSSAFGIFGTRPDPRQEEEERQMAEYYEKVASNTGPRKRKSGTLVEKMRDMFGLRN